MSGAVLDHPLIGARYFFPRPDTVDDDAFTVAVAGATLVNRWLFRAHPRTVVHFHGNGEVTGDWVDTLGPIVDAAGCGLLLVEYRGYGASTGGPALGAMLDDAVAVFDATGLDPARAVAFGRSVGSIFALELATARGLAGLALESGIHDVEERLRLRVTARELGVGDAAFTAAVKARLDHGAKLRALRAPVLVLHADDDELVTVDHGLKNAAAAADATLVRFPSGGHNGIFFENQAAYARALTAFLDRALPR